MSEPARRNRIRRPRRADPKRNLPRWDELWSPIPIESDQSDVVGWSHNYTGQEIVIRRDNGTVTVEARHGDLISEIDDFQRVQIALAFAEGFLEGHPEGDVI